MKAAQACAIVVLFALPVITGCGSTGVSTTQNPQDPGSGTTVSATVSPNSLSFGSATVGSSSSKTVTVTNTGTANLVITAINITGSAFTVPGVTLPLTIAPGASYTANVVFTPQAVGSASGSASVVSNLASSPTVVPLSGTGVSTPIGTLNVSPASLSFGNVNVGSSASKNLTLSNSGTATVNVQSISVTGLGFSIATATPFAVNAGKSTSVSVTFTAQTTGTANGTATFVSDAGNSPASVSLTGTGTTVTAHNVGLSWTASTSVVVGYNVYRGSQTGGPYQRLNTSLQSASGFSDSTVNSGQTYFYVVTAVDGSGNESAFSNEASAVIP
jgi:ASPM-SPD-2-Hydin domain-containing protein/centrosomal CEP192-like protein